jgi:hypothetical protein
VSAKTRVLNGRESELTSSMMGFSSLGMITTRTYIRERIPAGRRGHTFVHAILLFEIINSRPLVGMTRICGGWSDAGERQEDGDLQKKVNVSPAAAPDISLFSSRSCVACHCALPNRHDLVSRTIGESTVGGSAEGVEAPKLLLGEYQLRQDRGAANGVETKGFADQDGFSAPELVE